MDNRFIGQITSALQLDKIDFFIENLDRIRQDEGLQKSLLSLCLDQTPVAKKCFKYLVKNGFNKILTISYGEALREDKQETLDLIHDYKLFDIHGEQGKTLLNLCIANNDEKLFDKIKDIVTNPDENILQYALHGHNKNAIDYYQKKGFSWIVNEIETNPLIYIFDLYTSNKKGFIRLVLESHQHEDMLKFAERHFEDLDLLDDFQRLLPKNK